MAMKIYKFHNIYKPTIWGGDRLPLFKGDAERPSGIGESWEISGVKGSESIVEDGREAGTPLSELIARHGARLVGEKVFERFGTEFPLLIKFIHASKDLSVQVHPADELARERHGMRGKTEMWYVLDTDPGASLISGLRRQLTKDSFDRVVAEGRIMDYVARHEVKPGDCFYLPAGRIHSIGAGTLLVEIQETSDITYRIYDFGRLDASGKPRELHTALAKDAIDYTVEADYRTRYEATPNRPVLLKRCEHFNVSLLDMTMPQNLDLRSADSFVVVIVCDGEVTLTVDADETRHCRCGETLLVAAESQAMQISPASRKARVLLCVVD